MEQTDFSEFFHTRSESGNFMARIANISDKVFETGFNLEKTLDRELGLEKKDKFLVFLRENNVSLDSPKELKDFLDKLQQTISKLPILYINIAFDPSEETLKLLSEWFVLNAKKQFVFDILVKPDLLAGAVLNFNGRFFDYSAKTKFEKIVKNVMNEELGSKIPNQQQSNTPSTN